MSSVIITLCIIVAALFAISLILFATVAILIRNNICRPKHDAEPREDNPHFHGHYGRIKRGIDYYRALPKETVFITSHDGLKLAAELVMPDCDPRGLIVMMHGFHSSGEIDFSCAFKHYRENGLAMLVPYQRASGKSEGDYITFGIKERLDCRDWAVYASNRFPDLPIILDGVSLGASTVLMASGCELPESVRAIIADCGFTSPHDIMAHVLKLWYHLPEFPVMTVAKPIVKLIAGFGLSEYSTVEAMQINTRPILFAHGLADNFVPPEMTNAAFAACKAPKKLITAEHADHAMTFLENEAEYTAAIDELINSVCESGNHT